MYYSSFGLLALVLHIIINFEYIFPVSKTSFSYVSKRYKLFLWAVSVYYMSDILWGLLYENGMLSLCYLDTAIYFTAMAFSVYLWSRYVVAYLKRKGLFNVILTISGVLIFGLQIIAIGINFFAPILFHFDEQGVYRPGVVRYITLCAQIILFLSTSLYAIVGAFKNSGRTRAHHRTIAISGIIMTVFIGLQAAFPLLPFYAVGCLIATCAIHTFVAQDEKIQRSQELGSAKQVSYRDPLTGVKSAHAYIEAKIELDNRIGSDNNLEFGVIVFDLNELKQINDTHGHEEGDKYIYTGCMLICKIFAHSPVYRIGGDEFVVILEGSDYDNRDILINEFDRQISENERKGLVTISRGLDVYKPSQDSEYNHVFERADKKMYEYKAAYKRRKS